MMQNKRGPTGESGDNPLLTFSALELKLIVLPVSVRQMEGNFGGIS